MSTESFDLDYAILMEMANAIPGQAFVIAAPAAKEPASPKATREVIIHLDDSLLSLSRFFRMMPSDATIMPPPSRYVKKIPGSRFVPIPIQETPEPGILADYSLSSSDLEEASSPVKAQWEVIVVHPEPSICEEPLEEGEIVSSPVATTTADPPCTTVSNKRKRDPHSPVEREDGELV